MTGFVHGSSRVGGGLYPLVVLSTLTLFDASLVVLRLGGLLDPSKPSWILLAAAFFVSGPGCWAFAASLRPSVGRLLASVAPLGLLGVVYSTLLTQALRVGASESVAVGRLAGLTLLLLGVMEMLVVEDARRVLNGATRRCLGGIPLYIYPLLVLFALAVVVRGGPAAYTVYAAAVGYAALRWPPRGGSAPCTAAMAVLLPLALSLLVAGNPAAAISAALLSSAVVLAPLLPLGRLKRAGEAGVVDRLVLLGAAAAAAEAPIGFDAQAFMEDLAVCALVALLGWGLTALVAAVVERSKSVAAMATSSVLRHAAGFALVLASIHVLGLHPDPGIALLAAAIAAALVNTLARRREYLAAVERVCSA